MKKKYIKNITDSQSSSDSTLSDSTLSSQETELSTDQFDTIDYTIGIFDPEGINLNPLNGLKYSPTYKNLAKFWSGLPAYKMGKQIVSTIKTNDVILIESYTGSGKSVLIPKFALHSLNYKGNIIMSLPKRLITKNTALFSAKIADVEIGEAIGYAYRGESDRNNQTKLLYTTDGTIVALLKNDPYLKNVDIIIIDEAHERKVQIDLLLFLLKNTMKIRKEKNIKNLKLIIMSATINESIFRNYYKDFSYEYLYLSGKPNYPIESIYLEQPININQYVEKGIEIIINIVKKINDKDKKFIEGDILFFVCTVNECEQITLKLNQLINDAFIMGLYSGYDQELEEYIIKSEKYKELNENFKRRIFISTNVAESSITFENIIYVIDSGLEMSVRYDPINKINVMNKTLITKAQIAQRRGRAGRTRSGICYHLYTPKQELEAKDFPDPEILREDLKNVCLSLNKLGCQMNKKDFTVEETIQMFKNFIQCPKDEYIMDAFDFAKFNGLIHNDKLSQIGKLIVETRLDVIDGLTLLYAWNISTLVFKKVFKIICIQSYLKHGIEDFFHKDIEKNIINGILKKISKDCKNSEHLLLYKLYGYVESLDKSHQIGKYFSFDTYISINKLYSNQKERMEKIFKRFNIKLENIHKKDMETNVICSFNYGLKSFRAYKIKGNYKYNGFDCEIKSIFNFEKYYSVVFYTNLLINGKLNIQIISPWLLD
jgi:HrpA-like RNA helicase